MENASQNTGWSSYTEDTDPADDFPIVPDPHGFVTVAAVVPAVATGDPAANTDEILRLLDTEEMKKASIIVMPELCITGYTCGDLFFQERLLREAEDGIKRMVEAMRHDDRMIVVGAPVPAAGKLYNCAVVITGEGIPAIIPKRHIPNYQEFYERRWFSPAPDGRCLIDYADKQEIPFGYRQTVYHFGIKVGVELCEDLWVPLPPSTEMAMDGADIILNLSATNETTGKHAYLTSLIKQQSARCRCAYAYASAGRGESSTDLVFAGNAIIAEAGTVLAESPRFNRGDTWAMAMVDVEQLRLDRRKYNSFADCESAHGMILSDIVYRDDVFIIPIPTMARMPIDREVDPHPFVPSDPARLNENCEEITHIQSWGLEQRLLATGCRRLVVGISGGLDSTLALLIAVMAFRRLGYDLRGIIGVTMPGEATTARTRGNAVDLMEELGVTALEIPIGAAVARHFKDIGQNPWTHDATYENSQARERTQILMDLANKENAMVLGTGDLSELALGWCTYNGDHMSMYGVNAGVPKTLVRHLVEWFASTTPNPREAATLRDIIDTPISPELIPAADGEEIAQKTEELVGPYELHDFFLYHALRHGFTPSKIFRMARKAFDGKYDDETLRRWLRNFYRRFFSQQFKRSCMPDGPKVGSVCLSPRGDWRMPSDACATIWLKEVDEI